MKFYKYGFCLMSLLFILMGCTKENYDDVSFAQQVGLPENLSVKLAITQDNTGMVTITPNGEGASGYQIHFGDGTATPAEISPGNSVSHSYAEGQYTLRVVAKNLAGQTAEITQSLTVSFRAPENLEVTTAIDPSNNFQLNVSATALYETNFEIYFGDQPDEVPMSFLEGQTVNHIYAAPGVYDVRVVALSGGAATTEEIISVEIEDPLLLPLDFESTTLNYSFSNFDGGVVTLIANPQSNGINTSATVAQMVKHPGQPWGGSLISLSEPIDFSVNKVFRMKVFSPRVGAKVLLKVENATNSALSHEVEVMTTVANQWEDLVFDYNSINTANEYHNVVLIFDLGIMGDGSSNFTFLFDDIRLTNTIPSVLALPLNFESTSLNYSFVDFDGGQSVVIDNPHVSGLNTSGRVVRMIKHAQQTWGGSFLELAAPISFSANNTFKMKVYSPRVGAKVLLKVENPTNGSISFEDEQLTTVANAWEELSFDFTGISTTEIYQKIVVIFENGIMGDGTADFTFFYDDISLN